MSDNDLAFLDRINNIEEMQMMGLYINDLSMHDSSRDMVMAGCQHASRLEYSIEKVHLFLIQKCTVFKLFKTYSLL